MGFIVFCTSYI